MTTSSPEPRLILTVGSRYYTRSRSRVREVLASLAAVVVAAEVVAGTVGVVAAVVCVPDEACFGSYYASWGGSAVTVAPSPGHSA